MDTYFGNLMKIIMNKIIGRDVEVLEDSLCNKNIIDEITLRKLISNHERK